MGAPNFDEQGRPIIEITADISSVVRIVWTAGEVVQVNDVRYDFRDQMPIVSLVERR